LFQHGLDRRVDPTRSRPTCEEMDHGGAVQSGPLRNARLGDVPRLEAASQPSERHVISHGEDASLSEAYILRYSERPMLAGRAMSVNGEKILWVNRGLA
jgi:hypothetical protein